MKKNNYLLIAIVLLMFAGCNTSVKVLSAWKSKDIDQMTDRNILVIARTSDLEIRADFESSIANKLRNAGYKATESFTRFPKMDHDKEMTEEDRKRILEIFGYEGLLFLKRQELIKPVQDELYEAVEKVSKKKKIQIMFDKSGDMVMIYMNPQHDYTDFVLIELGLKEPVEEEE